MSDVSTRSVWLVDTIEVTQTAWARMISQAAENNGCASAGLLIGQRSDDRITVMRVLHCASQAVEARHGRPTIQRTVLDNVTRALERGDAEVVGLYRIGPFDAAAAALDIEPLDAPGALLHIAPHDGEYGDAQAWWLSAVRCTPVQVKVLDAKEGSWLDRCPD